MHFLRPRDEPDDVVDTIDRQINLHRLLLKSCSSSEADTPHTRMHWSGKEQGWRCDYHIMDPQKAHVTQPKRFRVG